MRYEDLLADSIVAFTALTCVCDLDTTACRLATLLSQLAAGRRGFLFADRCTVGACSFADPGGPSIPASDHRAGWRGPDG
jgi:hypothetical protein